MTGVNWIDKCSPVRDQGGCGSCTAFGTIGAWEPIIRIKLEREADLSERDLFFCSGGTCNSGNTMEPVLDRCVKGVATELCCPYVDYDVACGSGRCSDWWLTGEKLFSWKSIADIEEMKKALLAGPLVGVMAVHESFLHYVDGIYHSLGPSDPIVGYHCISIIGYDDNKNAWLLRNSWGTSWGMQGYCWISYGDSEIDQIMYQIEPTNEKPAPEPTPSPCRIGNNIAKLLNLFCELLHRKGSFHYMNP